MEKGRKEGNGKRKEGRKEGSKQGSKEGMKGPADSTPAAEQALL
jgi:hypothetical protein